MGGDSFTASATETAGATVTATLSGAAPGRVQQIYSLSIYAIGTVTAFTLQVVKADSSTNITKIGGQVGGAATGPLGPYMWDFSCPITCAVNDNAKVILTATGATACTVNINYKLATA